MSFDLTNAGVVITGGGGGIGAAMARQFHAAGARQVIVDLDRKAAETTARDVDGVHVIADAAEESGIEQIIATATDQLGGIDLFCANAGIAPRGGPDAPDEIWTRGWEINVMAHVRAARRLLPTWLERGHGRFLATVSAAGLLTMLGSAPYSVTKHATLAFAEWLSATYQHRGITVQALCPQGVRTTMLANADPAERLIMQPTAIDPDQVATAVVKALDDDRFLVLPHPEVADFYHKRAQDTDRWLANMNKLQRKIESIPSE